MSVTSVRSECVNICKGRYDQNKVEMALSLSLSLSLSPQDINAVYKGLLERDVKLHFLQMLTPAAVYPDRATASIPRLRSPTSPPEQNRGEGISESGERELEGSVPGSQAKRVKMDKAGLPWETVETVHWFMYPGAVPSTDRYPFCNGCPILWCQFLLFISTSSFFVEYPP